MRVPTWAGVIAAAVAVVVGVAPATYGAARADALPSACVIVKVQPGANINSIAAANGATLSEGDSAARLYCIALPGGANPRALAALQATRGVAYAEPNQPVYLTQAQQSSRAFYQGTITSGDYANQYALNLIGAATAQSISAGQGVTVAVLDTGVDLTHPALAVNLVPGYNVLQPNQAPADTPSSIDSDNDGQVNDALGHGTGVAGIIAAVAPQSRIMPIKVLDSEGMGTAFDVMEGIRYAVNHGAQVINLSLGMDSRSTAVAEALAYATSHNVVVVAAAGNTGTQMPLYPSGDPNVLTVAATDASDCLAPFSAYGTFINVTAPGVNIYSSYYNDDYALWSSTSMATPFVSGEAALLRALHPNDGVGVIDARVEGSAVPIDALNPAYAGDLGAGRIDLPAAVSQP